MAQTIKTCKIILVENTSTDASLQIVKNFPFDRLMAILENNGFARGNNLPIEVVASESEWITLKNPHAFADPRWLEALLAAAESHPEFALTDRPPADDLASALVAAGIAFLALFLAAQLLDRLPPAALSA